MVIDEIKKQVQNWIDKSLTGDECMYNIKTLIACHDKEQQENSNKDLVDKIFTLCNDHELACHKCPLCNTSDEPDWCDILFDYAAPCTLDKQAIRRCIDNCQHVEVVDSVRKELQNV